MSFRAALYKELLEQRRTKKLLIAIVVFVLFGIASPLMAKIMPQVFSMIPGGEAIASIIPVPTISDAVTQYLKNIGQFGILLALLFGMGAVAVEKDKGTAAMILSKPMPRGSFLLAKFASITVTFVISIILAGAAGYYYTYYLFGNLDITGWLGLNGLILVYSLLYTAITLFFSTLTRSQYLAIGMSFGVLIIFGVLGSIPTIGSYMPDALISNAALISLGGKVESWTVLWIAAGLILLSLFGSWLVFRKQEL